MQFRRFAQPFIEQSTLDDGVLSHLCFVSIQHLSANLAVPFAFYLFRWEINFAVD